MSRVLERVQEIERDRFVGLVKRAAENGMILLSEVRFFMSLQVWLVAPGE
jgi:hypothetical protein